MCDMPRTGASIQNRTALLQHFPPGLRRIGTRRPDGHALQLHPPLHRRRRWRAAVKNISGSPSGIDLVFKNRPVHPERAPRSPPPSAGSSHGAASWRVPSTAIEIEDVGWGIPCMTSSRSTATPDDDASRNGDGSCRYPAALRRSTAPMRGKQDYEDMGTLYVYDESASNNDRRLLRARPSESAVDSTATRAAELRQRRYHVVGGAGTT